MTTEAEDEEESALPAFERTLDDTLQHLAQQQRRTTGRTLARERFADRGIIRMQLFREAVAYARGQYRRNEEATKRRRRHIRYGNSTPSTSNLVKSSFTRVNDAKSPEQAADHLLQGIAESKQGTSDRRMIHDDIADPELIRKHLTAELEEIGAEKRKKVRMGRSVSKGMR